MNIKKPTEAWQRACELVTDGVPVKVNCGKGKVGLVEFAALIEYIYDLEPGTPFDIGDRNHRVLITHARKHPGQQLAVIPASNGRLYYTQNVGAENTRMLRKVALRTIQRLCEDEDIIAISMEKLP